MFLFFELIKVIKSPDVEYLIRFYKLFVCYIKCITMLNGTPSLLLHEQSSQYIVKHKKEVTKSNSLLRIEKDYDSKEPFKQELRLCIWIRSRESLFYYFLIIFQSTAETRSTASYVVVVFTDAPCFNKWFFQYSAIELQYNTKHAFTWCQLFMFYAYFIV